MRRIARPYVEALLGAAPSLEDAVRTRDELAELAAMMDSTPALARMTVNPAIPLEVKEKTLATLAEKAGFSPLTRRLVQALVTRYRLGRLSEILEGLDELLNERRGIAVARVRSAAPLTDDERERLVRVLSHKAGKRLQLELEVDSTLLAGFVAQVGSTYYDASLKGQLERLTAGLASA